MSEPHEFDGGPGIGRLSVKEKGEDVWPDLCRALTGEPTDDPRDIGASYEELLRLRDANLELKAEIDNWKGRESDLLAELQASFSVAQQTASDLELKLLGADEQIAELEEREERWRAVVEKEQAAGRKLESEVEAALRGQCEISASSGRMEEKLSARIKALEEVLRNIAGETETADEYAPMVVFDSIATMAMQAVEGKR